MFGVSKLIQFTGLLSLLGNIIKEISKGARGSQQNFPSDQAIAAAVQAAIDNTSAILSPKQVQRIMYEEQAVAVEERRQQWEEVRDQ